MTTPTGKKRALRLVHSSSEALPQAAWFCGKCAAPVTCGLLPRPDARVCRACGLGLLLEARADGAPAEGEAFLVVDGAMTVQAVSESAERLLEVREIDVIHRPVHDLLLPASTAGYGAEPLVGVIIDAVSGSGEVRGVFVRPINTFGVRMRARITACGPPRAALIVLETQRPHLHPLGAA
jgi:hypothetical protein